MRLPLATAVFFLSIFLAREANAGDLKVGVTGLRSGDGDVHLAIYNDPERFPDSDGMVADMIVPAKAEGVEAVFPGLAPGTYALAAYHDEDGDHQFDKNFFGFPEEGFAFSNGAKVFLSSPDFEDAAVTVGKDGSRITIPMSYW